MPLPPELRATMSQTAHVAPRSGVSPAGDPSFGSAVAVLCRAEPQRRRVVGAAGEEVISSWVMTAVPEATIGESDRVWLPGDSPLTAALARVPIRVDKGRDENGDLSHWEVYL